jgi:predicted NBD/HSP70 family sugar kinase
VELIRKVLESSLDTGELLGVSLCVPGIVDSDAREWVFSARWPRLRRLSLHDAERALGVRIHVRRQLDVLLEYAMLKEPALRTGGTLLFHWGYGIGAAFSMNGKVIGSSKGVFCQIGHVSIHPRSTKPCLCGRIGCLEADAALWALTPEIERTEGAVPESELDFVKMFNERPIASTEYFRNALFSVIHAVSHLQAILIPDRVIMYGPFLANEQVFRTLTTEVKQLSPPFVTENTSFELMDDSLGWHAAAGTISIFHQAYRVTLLRRGAQTAGQPISAALREFL